MPSTNENARPDNWPAINLFHHPIVGLLHVIIVTSNYQHWPFWVREATRPVCLANKPGCSICDYRSIYRWNAIKITCKFIPISIGLQLKCWCVQVSENDYLHLNITSKRVLVMTSKHTFRCCWGWITFCYCA